MKIYSRVSASSSAASDTVRNQINVSSAFLTSDHRTSPHHYSSQGSPRLLAWSLGVSFGSAYYIPSGAEILHTRAGVQYRLSHPWPISPSYYNWQNLPKNIHLAAMRQGVRESGIEFPEGEINLILWIR